ncbi:MAG TPA: (Fe-S)-binding protein, partial [Polyangia bacterium]
LYPQVALSVARVLRHYGCQVDIPRLQTCCGQPAFNSGYPAEARRVARTLIEAFRGADWVVTPSGSCGGMVHHHHTSLFADDPALRSEAEDFAGRVYEFSQFMMNVLGVDRVAGAFPHKVTYHPSCHGARLLGVRDEPLEILRRVPGLELAPLPKAEDCCGFGGTFAVKLAPISVAMTDEKISHVVGTGASFLAGTDMGCLMNIAGRMQATGVAVQAIHIAELVDRCLHPEARSQ